MDTRPPFDRFDIMNTLRFGVGFALATFWALAHAHAPEGHPGRPRRHDASSFDERGFGREGDPGKVTRTIRMNMTNAFRFTPSEVVVQRGETVRFVVANSGKVLHEMVLGTDRPLQQHAELMRRFPAMEHAAANMAHVQPGATGEIIWQFTQAGEFPFACLLPGHYEAGMTGRVLVR